MTIIMAQVLLLINGIDVMMGSGWDCGNCQGEGEIGKIFHLPW